jgi:hypothetical protein
VGIQNRIYSVPMTVTNGLPPYSWSISAGTLPPGLTLAPTTGVISGTPIALGANSFTVRVTDSNSQSDAIAFSVAIEPPPPVVVTLTWTASTSVVAGYNVYRGSVSGGVFTRLNSTLITGTSYVDATILGGQTYIYVVTAENAGGAESLSSNEATAVVP